MTQLCYTLEESAERLSLSETVLVRLSQYFKIPQAAYEASGYLSFKGDLTFSEPDIGFFRQVKERLLVGESLDDIKRRVNDKTWVPSKTPVAPVVPAQPAAYAGPALPNAGQVPVQAMPIREIEDRAPYEKAAEQSFERYKSMHRTGLGKVFENMIKEVGATASKKRNAAPDLKPMRARMKAQPSGTDLQLHKERVLPFNRKPLSDKGQQSRLSEKPQEARPSRYTAPPNERWIAPPRKPEAGWDAIIQDAVNHPRVLNNHLKNAAALLKERALQPQNPSRRGQQPE